MNTIGLSKHLNVTRKQLEDKGVYDTTLGIDTKLFVDPKLLVGSDIPEFNKSREKVTSYFSELFKWLKHSGTSPRLQEKTIKMLAVPEPQGLSMGHGNKSDRGTAIPKSLAKEILRSASELLSIGIEDAEIIEVLTLFVKDFGSDRLSDLVSYIVYDDFCKYTERCAQELGVKTEKFTFGENTYSLPKHPFLTKVRTPIIFVPNDFLRPIVIAKDWDGIADAARQNEKLREDFNAIILDVLKDELEKFNELNTSEKKEAKQHFERLISVYKDVSVSGYDLNLDESGYYFLRPFIEKESEEIKKLKKPTTREELLKNVRALIGQYQKSVVSNGGNKLLYHRTSTGAVTKKPHREEISQLLFYFIADIFCSKSGIIFARESNAGRGPVDFWLSNANDSKVLVEIKKSTNSDLVKGFEKQVVEYQKSEAAFHSFYVVLIVKDRRQDKNGAYLDQLEQLQRIAETYKKEGKKTPELVIIDALIYPSPSKL